MDIQHLVDRLEDLIDEGRHIFGTRFTIIDEERALEIIDQMRISIPEEIEKAARVIAQRDRVLAQANEEAARILQAAREQGEHLIDREEMVQKAMARANSILEAARQEASSVTSEADNYVLEVLSRLEQHLVRSINVVRNGITEVSRPAMSDLQQEEAPMSVPMPRPRIDVNLPGESGAG